MKRGALILQLLEKKDREEKSIEYEKENMPSSPSVIEDSPLQAINKNQRQILKQCTETEPINNSAALEKPSIEPSNVDSRRRSNSKSSSSSSSSSSSGSSSSSSRSSSSSSSSSTSGKSSTPSTSAPSTSNLRPTTDRPCYTISPVNKDESDVDLSDTDPTYTNTQHKNVRISCSSLSSSHTNSPSSLNEEINTAEKKKTRKRKRNPDTWKQNKTKILRNSGKAYQSLSKSKKNVPARCMKNPCTSKCRLKCSDNIKEQDRATLFKNYWGLSNLELQRAYIKSCMLVVQPRYKYTNAEKPRLPNNAFYFTIDHQRIRVCKLFFINTLDISDRQLRTIKRKCNGQGFLEPEMRGKHDSKKKVELELIEQIKKHIESIPRIESHYLRASTSREYICGSKSVKDLLQDFNNDQREKNLPEAEYWLYLKTFNTEFNLAFFIPKKDRCESCVSYELAPADVKPQLKANYELHLKEKDLCREEKRQDRQMVDETHICSVFDLQSVMLCPSPAYFYYSSKLNCLNFTITELKKKETEKNDEKSYGDVYCYFWDETKGQRGANEIGSCIFDYLGKLSKNNTDKILHITFYSDNCIGQNKNKMIASLYSYAVAFYDNIESITHKFLIKGHTHNEADNVHSLIEKEIKKNEKAGPIYIPLQFATLIKSARKTGKPFMVNELSHHFFINLKHLQEQWGYNFNENVNKDRVLWNDIKTLKFIKGENFSFYYKTTYQNGEFSVINMRPKRKKMLPFEQINLTPLYEHPLGLKENKKRDLMELVRKKLIPSSYTTYYEML